VPATLLLCEKVNFLDCDFLSVFRAPDFQIDCVSILKQLLIVFAKHNNEVAFAQYNQAIVVIAKYIGMTLKVHTFISP
jgi:hypothetical protein